VTWTYRSSPFEVCPAPPPPRPPPPPPPSPRLPRRKPRAPMAMVASDAARRITGSTHLPPWRLWCGVWCCGVGRGVVVWGLIEGTGGTNCTQGSRGKVRCTREEKTHDDKTHDALLRFEKRVLGSG
jgi:hypothetical protein